MKAPSVRTKRSRRQALGFTLLELLVVIAMLAILAVGVSLSLRGNANAALSLEAERLRGLLELARDESQVAGVTIEWQATPGGYRFARGAIAAETGFPEPALDERLRLRDLPAPLVLSRVEVAGKSLAAGSGIAFVAGIAPTFRIELTGDGGAQVIVGRANGAIELAVAAG